MGIVKTFEGVRMFEGKSKIFNAPILFKLILQNVKNPWTVFLCYIQKEARRRARFMNGLEIEFDRHNVYRVYDALMLLTNSKIRIRKLRDGFLVETPELSTIRKDLELLENFEEVYRVVDYAGKVVLDVGGYIGDTAVAFKKWGAKKVIVYEPLEENVRYLRRNVKLHDINAEIHRLAVWNKDGEIMLMIEGRSLGTPFFNLKLGATKVRLKAISWKNVLDNAIRKGVEIAKVDCEGAERFLPYVDDQQLKKIPFWIIESHNQDIEHTLVEHFTSIGFDYRIIKHGGKFSVIFFYRL